MKYFTLSAYHHFTIILKYYFFFWIIFISFISTNYALTNCWGFVDGTVRPVCRPTHRQKVMYNGHGHKCVHALKFQSVVAANGMIAHLFGPIEGRRHDSFMLRQSGLLDELQQFSVNTAGQIMSIYGDPAYPLRAHLQAPFKGNLSLDQANYNKSMSSVRVSVEWLFGDIINFFKFVDFKKSQKVVYLLGREEGWLGTR